MSKKDENFENKSSLSSEETDSTLNHFGITASELENLMTLYKERGSSCEDLTYIKNIGGINSLMEKLQTNPQLGISSIDYREESFGSNKIFIEPVSPFCTFVLNALEDLMIRILIVAAIVQIILGTTLSDNPKTDWIDGVSIIVAVVIVVLVGSITDYKKELKFHELNDIQNSETKYTVVRNGISSDLVSDDLLVGDIVNVTYGDILPADMILIEGNGIKMDESSLTGESDTVKKEIYDKCIEEKENGKQPHSMLLLSGTNCVEGCGKAVVIAVGDHSQKGIIRRTVDNAQEDSKTPLENKLDDIAESISYFGMGAALVTLVALGIRFIIKYVEDTKNYNLAVEKGVDKNKLTDPKTQVPKKLLDIVILCVAIIAVAIPEGLPLAVTLSLAFSIKKLMDQNNLVRKMHACETMGGANYICTDKTGTLTKNEMNVYQILSGDKTILLKQNLQIDSIGKLDNEKNENQVKIRENPLDTFNEDYFNILRTAISLNVECTITRLNEPNINGDYEVCDTKNKTDMAFIDFLYRMKSPISEEKNKYLSSSENYKQFPFDSQRKRMTTFVKNESFPTGYRLFSKGGAENVLSYCDKYLTSEGKVENITNEIEKYIKDQITEFNSDKLRSLYICYKDISEDEYNNCEQLDINGKLIDQSNLTFICVFGIRDSLRDGVKEAVLKCHEAQVNVIMVTGDNIVTATSIAKDCHILDHDVNLKNLRPCDIELNPEEINDPNKKDEHIEELLQNQPQAMTGASFYAAINGLICEVCNKETNLCKCPKTEAEAEEIAKRTNTEPKEIKRDIVANMNNFIKLSKNLRVLARSQPIHKYALVLGLKSLEKVVAVTGDGTNDAPALSKSDVGFAMFAGTDIAKEASDIVILDNNFSSIVIAIIYGRNIYDNIRKFLQFQLTVNFCACLLVFICGCIGNETPLTSVQMLWVNLIMDSLGSLALATEPPYEELLQREPTRKNESIINLRMWKHISIQSLFQLALLLIVYLIGPKFLKEQDKGRLAENSTIMKCYGTLPGNISDLTHIIYGIESKWDNNIKLVDGANAMDCGNYAQRQDLGLAFKEYISNLGSTSHMTIIFNTFVFYTLFNQINCRVINDQINIFSRIHRCWLFILITGCEMGLQALLVEFGRNAFHCAKGGLTIQQWGMCFLMGALTFVVSFFIKFIPVKESVDDGKEDEKEIIINVDDGDEKEKLIQE